MRRDEDLIIAISIVIVGLVLGVILILTLLLFYNPRRICPPGEVLIDGVCVNTPCINNSQCRPGEVCIGGTCIQQPATVPPPARRPQRPQPSPQPSLTPPSCDNTGYTSYTDYTSDSSITSISPTICKPRLTPPNSQMSESVDIYKSDVTWSDDVGFDNTVINSFYHSSKLLLVYRNGDIEYSCTQRIVGNIDIYPDYIASLGNSIVVLSNGILYKRELTGREPMSILIADTEISSISSTLDSKYLWIQTGSSASIYDSNMDVVDTLSVDPNSIRKYGYTLSEYASLNRYSNTLTIYPSMERIKDIKDFSIGHDFNVCTLSKLTPGNRIIVTESECLVISI